MATVMTGYADRPALGERARTWHHHDQNPVRAGDFVCVLGFASIDYTAIEMACIHLGAVVVPLQTSAPASQHAPILAETRPAVLAVGIDYLETAVEAALADVAPRRIIVFGYEPRDDEQRKTFEAATTRLATTGSALTVEAIDDVVTRGASLSDPPLHVAADGEDPLAWLFYTSGSTGTPRGAMFTESLCIGTWLAQSGQPVITLSYMPMSHLIGYGYVIMTLANGGVSYFAARSDLSTLFDDLALARPTTLSLVPRVCEMFYHQYLSELDRLTLAGPAEAPLIGTDLGEEFDDNFVLPEGMALVLEPVIWQDGTGGYRSEEIVVTTDDGWYRITDYPYTPYGN